MFLRKSTRTKAGTTHTYFGLVESVRTEAGPRQQIVADLGELNADQQRRWQRTVVFHNRQGDAQQLRLYPEDATIPFPMIPTWFACGSVRRRPKHRPAAPVPAGARRIVPPESRGGVGRQQGRRLPAGPAARTRAAGAGGGRERREPAFQEGIGRRPLQKSGRASSAPARRSRPAIRSTGGRPDGPRAHAKRRGDQPDNRRLLALALYGVGVAGRKAGEPAATAESVRLREEFIARKTARATPGGRWSPWPGPATPIGPHMSREEQAWDRRPDQFWCNAACTYTLSPQIG